MLWFSAPTPSQERLGAVDAAVGDAHNRLEEEPEVGGRDPGAKILLEGEACGDRVEHLGIEDFDRRFSALTGEMRRGGCFLQHVGRRERPATRRRDPDAEHGMQALAADDDRCRQGFRKPLRLSTKVAGGVVDLDHDDEVGDAEVGDDGVVTDERKQASRKGLKYRVAELRAPRVCQDVEAVDLEVHDRQVRLRTEKSLELREQSGTVQQTGRRVAVRDLSKGCLRLTRCVTSRVTLLL